MTSPNLQKKFLPDKALSPALPIFTGVPDGEWEGAGLGRSVHVREFLEVASCFRQSLDFKVCCP